MQQTAVVTGGTGGLGAAVTRAFLDDGWRVVVPWVVEPSSSASTSTSAWSSSRPTSWTPTRSPGSSPAAGRLAARAREPRRRLRRARPRPRDADRRRSRRSCASTCARPTSSARRRCRRCSRPAGRDRLRLLARRTAARSPARPATSTAKAAVLAFVDVLDAEYRADGIRANAILPSVIDTPANRALDARRRPRHAGCAPGQIAAVIRHLARPRRRADQRRRTSPSTGAPDDAPAEDRMVDAHRRLRRDVHAAARHHDRERRAAGHRRRAALAASATCSGSIDAYALSLAALLLTGGSLAPVGRRRVFVLGLGLFTVASLLCGLAGVAAVPQPRPRAAGHRRRGDVRHVAGADRRDFQGAERGTRVRRLGRDDRRARSPSVRWSAAS